MGRRAVADRDLLTTSRTSSASPRRTTFLGGLDVLVNDAGILKRTPS